MLVAMFKCIEPNEFLPRPPIPVISDSFSYYPQIYTQILQVVSSLHVPPPKKNPCM